MYLEAKTFKMVVARTPLVSIDLVVQNEKGEILLGQRLNRPAQGFWFVPGGRILKNETLDSAFSRLTREELGLAFERSEARLLDVYEHFYQDSVFGTDADAPSTHYVVLGYQITLSASQSLTPPAAQHGDYKWWSPSAIQSSATVHQNTRAYLSALLNNQ